MFYARIDLRTNNSKPLYLHAIPQVEINCGVELNPPCKRDLAVANKRITIEVDLARQSFPSQSIRVWSFVLC